VIITSVITNNSNATVSYRYKRSSEENTSYVAAKPTDTGEYTARGILSSNANYTGDTAYSTFNIKRIEGVVDLSIADIVYGDFLSVVISKNNPAGIVTVYYKHIDSTDDYYSTTEPVNRGIYNAFATMTGDNHYAPDTSDIRNFTIKKNNGILEVSCNSIIYGSGTIYPIVVKNTNSENTPVFFYKKQGESDATFSTVTPTQAGAYVLRATVAQTDNYTAATSPSFIFNIYKAVPSFNLPTNIIAVEDYPLQYAMLPDSWRWFNPQDIAGTAHNYYLYKAIYTPDDNDNYDTAHAFISTWVITKEESAIEDEIADNIIVYPNPTKGILNIKNITDFYEIYDQTGRIIMKSNNEQVNIEKYPNGIYFIKIKNRLIRFVKTN
jgi:hypothetical protein